jgi:hypothetical protein
LVTGGRTQRLWQHSVPKVASAAGPRISLAFRHGMSGWYRTQLDSDRSGEGAPPTAARSPAKPMSAKVYT